jgi:hypothetical protein
MGMMEAALVAAAIPVGFGRACGECGDQARGREYAGNLDHLDVPFELRQSGREVAASLA